VFLRRFFGGQQFKRSALPNSPKVSMGGSLSPRGDWRAPSDGVAGPWLDELSHGPEISTPSLLQHDCCACEASVRLESSRTWLIDSHRSA
jgi:hypothetical protein